jgi:dUTP pyrophosphatase
VDNTEAQKRLMEAIDPNNDYSMEDFNEEFNNINTTVDMHSYKIPLKFVNKSVNKDNDSGKNQNPEFAKDGDSGFDVRANVSETVVLMPTRLSLTKGEIKTEYGSKSIVENVELIHGETKVIPTGLFFEIPENYEIQVRSRSGLSAKAQVVVTNSPGTVDSGYRGELKIILTNHGDKVFHIKNGDRIAQCIFSNALTNKWVSLDEVNEISDNTERSESGFGSSGIK